MASTVLPDKCSVWQVMLIGMMLSVFSVTAMDNDSNQASGEKPGLIAHYYKDHTNWGGLWPKTGEITGAPEKWTFTNYAFSRPEPLVNHLFIRDGWFSIRWQGMIKTLERGNKKEGDLYTFYIWADDGCRLVVDGKTIIDSWKPTWEKAPDAVRKATIRLKPGNHRISIEYFQGSSLVRDDKDPMKLYWQCNSLKLPKQIIPASRFTHRDTDLFAVPGRQD